MEDSIISTMMMASMMINSFMENHLHTYAHTLTHLRIYICICSTEKSLSTANKKQNAQKEQKHSLQKTGVWCYFYAFILVYSRLM